MVKHPAATVGIAWHKRVLYHKLGSNYSGGGGGFHLGHEEPRIATLESFQSSPGLSENSAD